MKSGKIDPKIADIIPTTKNNPNECVMLGSLTSAKKVDGLEKGIKTVKQDLTGVKKQLNNVEMKVEFVNKRVEQAQEETIDALSELIHEGYNQHEKRIKKLEENFQPPQTQ